jgi:hypothetical protein
MPYILAVGIPLMLIACGAFARKLVRGSEWIRSDFFLGVELALAAMASSLVFVSELAQSSDTGLLQNKALLAGAYAVACFFFLLWVMAVHQDWEKRPQDFRGQLIWLGGFSNLIGIALLTGFVLLVKGASST